MFSNEGIKQVVKQKLLPRSPFVKIFKLQKSYSTFATSYKLWKKSKPSIWYILSCVFITG